MLRLFQRVEKGLQAICDVMSTYLREKGAAIMKQQREAEGDNVAGFEKVSKDTFPIHFRFRENTFPTHLRFREGKGKQLDPLPHSISKDFTKAL